MQLPCSVSWRGDVVTSSALRVQVHSILHVRWQNLSPCSDQLCDVISHLSTREDGYPLCTTHYGELYRFLNPVNRNCRTCNKFISDCTVGAKQVASHLDASVRELGVTVNALTVTTSMIILCLKLPLHMLRQCSHHWSQNQTQSQMTTVNWKERSMTSCWRCLVMVTVTLKMTPIYLKWNSSVLYLQFVLLLCSDYTSCCTSLMTKRNDFRHSHCWMFM